MNYKHLHYFLQVAETGSVAAASRQLHLTPQTISGQIQLLADRLGGPLFEKVGRRLELTDTGHLALGYAREIFSLGAELEAAVRERTLKGRTLEFRVGVADAVPKSIAYHLVEPALKVAQPVRIVCREWRLDRLLSELAMHTLDLVIADAPVPHSVSVKAFSHHLGGSAIGVFAAPSLLAGGEPPFPACLDGAPLLMPGEDTAVGQRLRAWFESQGLGPRVVAEFDDSALAQEFGRQGVGYLLAPAVLADEIQSRLQVRCVGTIDEVREDFYAISVERRITHPCVLAITRSARAELFHTLQGGRGARAAARRAGEAGA
ncbi:MULTISPECIES: transcriptional activator NhaR [unclassified Rubrivivax]|uniref:transcriptional activator NhaR n=1 Tax=unclassified Rubrivivax TaxID=2649762 RepID=UPI0013E97B8E|nr:MULTISPECIES: transcriptional activator NhaR [unclassified Rubrivivax]MCC9597021.1 transcriptional activator NhaR [Rubrivivax sp. JA1055]MCC9646720.1 transcriptional activator NhaR [Rubrivivax sp. JA1029]